MPSSLSNIPPWPGKIFPVSFILAFLFKYEINKSPLWLINETKRQKIMLFWLICKFKYSKLTKIIKDNIAKINEPIEPDIVLFGLILVNFLPPNVLPNTYPPISVKKHMQIR